MLFNSVQFGFFFIAVWVAVFLTPMRWRWTVLLLASCAFYAAWDYRYLALVGVLAGLAFVYGRFHKAVPPFGVAALLALLLVPLAVIKYGAFLGGMFARWTDTATPSLLSGWELPLGISFYTFQLLAYCVDVRANRCEPVRNPFKLLLYPLYFPHQIAGPIVRPRLLLPQFDKIATAGGARMVSGLQILLWGLVKKVFVADRLAVLVDAVYADPQTYSGAGAWLAVYFFAIQIYCDFSGYSDMAIGLSRILGIELCENFRRPYFSASLKEFWGRWHISLSTWFRDYVYVPLGGNQRGLGRWAIAVVVVFGLSGLWHGAAVNFLLWGFYHGLLFLGERGLRAAVPPSLRSWASSTPGAIVRVLLVFHLVALGWILFRAPSWESAVQVFQCLGVGGGWGNVLQVFSSVQLALAAAGIVLVLLGDLALENRWVCMFPRLWLPLRWSLYYAAIFLVGLFPGSTEIKQFIYFQF
ncbi:MAG: MBOAT family O-acyltransferase [Bacteroidota bacterium]